MLRYYHSCQPLIKKGLKNKNANQGFTLIELLLSLAIGSIIVLCIYSSLNFTINSCKLGDIEDEVLLNGQYALEYIKREIKEADEIIGLHKLAGMEQREEKYKNNLGFVIKRYDEGASYKYNYSTYYYKDNSIYRDAFNTNDAKLPRGTALSGSNEVAEYIVSIEGTDIDFDAKLIKLSFTLKGEGGRENKFQTKLSIRCPITY